MRFALQHIKVTFLKHTKILFIIRVIKNSEIDLNIRACKCCKKIEIDMSAVVLSEFCKLYF